VSVRVSIISSRPTEAGDRPVALRFDADLGAGERGPAKSQSSNVRFCAYTGISQLLEDDMRLPTSIITALAIGAFGGAGISNVSHPTVAFAQTTATGASAVDATANALAARLSLLAAQKRSVDRAYAVAMSELQPAIVKLCRTEIASGNDPKMREAATHILTVQQENDEYVHWLEETFHIDHSP